MSDAQHTTAVPAVQHAEFFARLAAPFDPSVIRRLDKGRAGSFNFVRPRPYMNRLDEVCGPAGWRDEYTETRDGLKCRLWIRTPDGEWSWKEDGGGAAGMDDGDNDEKSMFSSAFKRACVKWGVGRHLYGDGVPSFVTDFCGEVADDHRSHADYDRPSGHQQRPRQPERQSSRDDRGGPPQGQQGGHDSPPRSGRGLFARIKELEQQHEVSLLKALNRWGSDRGFPDRMVDYSPEQVAAAFAEAQRLLADAAGGGQYEPEPAEAY